MMNIQELQIKIGKEIKQLRLMNHWTQEQIAEQLHLCRNAYSDIELGKTDIHLSRLVHIANFFGVDISYFIDDKEKTVFYLMATQTTQFDCDRINYYFGATEEKSLIHKLGKTQLIIEYLYQEIADKQKLIESLELLLKNVKGN